jgi:dTDP-4-amino-4,6-dideoxygalactose transaminase
MNDAARAFDAFREPILAAVTETLASGAWLNGSRTRKFADAFAQFVGTKYCVPLANGTDALELAMRALMMARGTKGSEIITVTNAGGYAVSAARQLGLVPVFVDVERESQLLEARGVVAALGPKTAMVVVTHLYGGAVDVPQLRGLIDAAGYRDLPIIEDCAQAHGATVGSARVGSLGTIATFSFYPTKNLGAAGDAGVIVTSDSKLYELVERLRQYGWSSRYQVSVPNGRNSRMDEIQAAVLLTLLPQLETMNDKRRRIFDAYRTAAGDRISFLAFKSNSVVHLAVALCRERERLRGFLDDRAIATDVHYPVLDCDQMGWRGSPHRIGPRGIEISRASVAEIVTLPCFPWLTDVEVGRVVDALAEWRRTN